MTTRTRTRLAAVAAGTALALAGCATADTAASPGDAMEARLAQGTTVAVTLEADPEALTDPDAAAELSDMLDVTDGGPLMTVGLDPDGAVTSMSFVDAIEVRRIGNDVYLRVDWDRIDQLEGADLEEDPRAAIQELGTFFVGAEDLAAALAAGEWIGITDVGDSADELLGDLMAPTPGATAPGLGADSEEVAALMEEYDLDSVGAFLDTYVTAEGDNPWELTVDGAALQQALEDVEAAAAEAGVTTELTGDVALPDTITGITMTATDGMASEVRIDMVEVGSAMAATMDDDMADVAEMAAAEPTLVLTMTDLGDNGGAPAEATTIPMADLLTMMGDMSGEFGDLGGLGELDMGELEG
jgi:hypothetical protein